MMAATPSAGILWASTAAVTASPPPPAAIAIAVIVRQPIRDFYTGHWHTVIKRRMQLPEIEEVLPKYLQIAGYLRDQIVRGDLSPGAEVPSVRVLAATWGVARPTATKALQALRQQGLVESRRGSGTYANHTPPHELGSDTSARPPWARCTPTPSASSSRSSA
ncbi:GntR family transcriptional regulator [Nocardia sp. NPDC051750]|uniref:GntR family transcriptional regulator n=1 Tax=Nocardia sp. NPDC051750 TaxID=3364325 RepID=UPI0037AF415C